jgi:flagellar motor switch protein FliM
MPFLAAQNASVTLNFARAMPVGDLLAELGRPLHATQVVLAPGRAKGAVVLDAGAIAIVLDGVLGGDGKSPPRLDAEGLSAAQRALVTRVIDSIVRAYGDVLQKKFGFSLQASPADAEDATTEGAPVTCSLEVSTGGHSGHVVLLLAKEALLTASDPVEQRPRRPDPRVVAVVEGVELEVVAELARVNIALGRLAGLRKGDVIRLETPVGGTVSVRADGHVLLRGHPTTSGGQIAIRVVARHER